MNQPTPDTAAALINDPTPARVSELLTQIDARLDQAYSNFDRLNRDRIDCKPGCSHCCHRVVPAQIPDVIRVAEHIRSTFTEDQLAELKQRLNDYERAVAPNFGRDLHKLRPTCPLLVNNLCSVYEARPIRCRGIFSADANACEQAKLHPESKAFPALAERQQIAFAAWTNLEEGIKKGAKSGGAYDFGRALKIAIENPEAVQEWLAGEDSFGEAFATPPVQESPPAPVRPGQPKYLPGTEPTGRFDIAGLALPQYIMSREGNFQKALDLAQGDHPGYWLWQIRLPMTYSSEAEVLEWRDYYRKAIDRFKERKWDPREAYDGLAAYCPQSLSYQQFNNREILEELGALTFKITSEALPDLTAPIEGKRREGKIRVGYISRSLRHSSCSPWGLGWLKNHGPEFETYAFHMGDVVDRTTEQFRQAADHFYHLPPGQPVPNQAQLIRSQDLDALIFLDVGVNTGTAQFDALRLARVQCAAWGGPETTGLPTMDYYLSSELMEDPTGDEEYSEKLIRLPGIGVCFLREKLRPSTLFKSDFGLGDEPLYLSTQPPLKLAPQWDELYRRINEATGQPISFIDRKRTASQKVWDRMERNGVKIRLLPLLNIHDYFGLIKLADVVLDSPGWNGGITTIQTLTMGTPVVTLPTELKRGRHSLAMLQASNAPGLVARDIDDYVDLVANVDRRRSVVANIDPNGLYEDMRPVRALEDFLKSVLT
jgi:Fe-S-cluster containining protein